MIAVEMSPRHRLPQRHRVRIAVAALLAASTVTGAFAASSQAATPLSDVGIAIPMPDGVTIAAEVVTAAGPGPHPLVVVPGPWGSNHLANHWLALPLGNAGYDVVSFADRGMGNSQGVTDYADPTSVSDVSSLIDWAVQKIGADPTRVATMGVSYGGGLALLAAEHDSRIKAVAALSTWADWGSTFANNGSLALDTLRSLAGTTTGSSPRVRVGTQAASLFANFTTDPAGTLSMINAMSASRSPSANVAALNANHTAVFMANGIQDSLLPPRQLVNLFGALTGPKRLELRTGDHAQPEAVTMYGGSTAGPVADAMAWLDHYVRGSANGADTAPAVTLQDTTTGAITTYPSWPGAAGAQTVPLGMPGQAQGTDLGPAIASSTWTRGVIWGLNTYAETTFQQADVLNAYRVASVNVSGLSDYFSFIWNGPVLTDPQSVDGVPSLAVTAALNQPGASFVAYLYDMSPASTGQLLSAVPMTLSGLTPGVGVALKLQFQPVAWTIPAGHHVSLVIDSLDHRWSTTTVSKTVLTLSSTTTAPAQLVLPAP